MLNLHGPATPVEHRCQRAIIGMSVLGDATEVAVGVTEVLAYGTAVRIERAN